MAFRGVGRCIPVDRIGQGCRQPAVAFLSLFLSHLLEVTVLSVVQGAYYEKFSALNVHAEINP
jgi:hypothetical protein